MPLTPGTTLGPYSVIAKIGEGGMGEVYQARDTKLDRDVALKVLSEAFTSDPDRLARFEREAKVLASLNHPNIGTIYGVEEAEGIKALVLELIEGPTLADRIKQGPIPIDEALPIAKQIAGALEAAHEAGVIHRDLKPANIKVREDGTVKVLDFGLAKALDPAPAADPDQSPTLTAAATQMGVIMGTAAYMSPEQARGKPVDKRTDIWAFGCVLFEMLSSRTAFTGQTQSDTIAQVIEREPAWHALPENTPGVIQTLLRRCLDKAASERLRDIGDARVEIRELTGSKRVEVQLATTATERRPEQRWPRRWRPALGLVATMLVSGAIGGLAYRSWLGDPGRDVHRFSMGTPLSAPFSSGSYSRGFAISPDGNSIVYASTDQRGFTSRLYVRELNAFEPSGLRGAEDGAGPFFSPDGQWVGFLDSNKTSLWKVASNGGVPALIAETSTLIFGASWGDDDDIVFGTLGRGLFRVSADGGAPEALTTLDSGRGEGGHRWPSVIPGRGAVVFVIGQPDPLSPGELAVLTLDSGAIRRLGLFGGSPRYISTGHLLYVGDDRALKAVRFDTEDFGLTGEPVPLVEGIAVKPADTANFDIAPNGTLVYEAAGENRPSSRLVMVDRNGEGGVTVWEGDGNAWYPRFSPDGSRVAFAVAEEAGNAGAADLYVHTIDRGATTKLTFGDNNRFFPVWSPDGDRLAYTAGSGSANKILLAAADGSGEAQTILDVGERQFPTSWAPDGSGLVLYKSGGDATNRDLYTLPLNGDIAPIPFFATPFEDRGAAFSPNGKWIAYVSGKSGRDEIYIRPYPGPGGEVIISSGGGQEAVWARDGSELYYRHDGQLKAVVLDEGPSPEPRMPAELFDDPFVLDNAAGGGGNPNYDISDDGQFVFVDSLMSRPPTLRLVLDWTQELLEHVPVN